MLIYLHHWGQSKTQFHFDVEQNQLFLKYPDHRDKQKPAQAELIRDLRSCAALLAFPRNFNNAVLSHELI
ncbi:hypothetical protein D3C76_1496080 [compost metagenome]